MDPYVIVDVETTGLEATEEVMLEIGMVLVDPISLSPLDMFESIIVPDPPVELIYDSCIPLVQEMHRNSGLWDDLYVAEQQDSVSTGTVGVQQRAVDKLTGWMRDYDFQRPPMMGNSVKLDWDFIYVHMPTLSELFHYRTIDVSTFKEVFSRRNPSTFALAPKEQPGADQPHRVIADCLATLGEFEFYSTYLFVEPEVTA